jgi:hypothetical protein
MSGSPTIAAIADLDPDGHVVPILREATRLGARCFLVSRVTDSGSGLGLLENLDKAGIEITHVERMCRTSLESSGGIATPALGMKIPVDALFTADICLIDLADLRLFRFLVDLPVHTYPTARLLGLLTRLPSASDARSSEIIERLDAIAGTDEDLLRITGAGTLLGALAATQAVARAANLHQSFVRAGDRAIALDRERCYAVRFDQETRPWPEFAGAVAAGIARRSDIATILSHIAQQPDAGGPSPRVEELTLPFQS